MSKRTDDGYAEYRAAERAENAALDAMIGADRGNEHAKVAFAEASVFAADKWCEWQAGLRAERRKAARGGAK